MRLRFLALLGSLALIGAARAATTYCCADERGRQICSDVLPQQCYGRAYREISERGVTLNRVDAPLTGEQRARRDAEQKARQEEEKRQIEQQRKDRALLTTYANEQEIDILRDRTLADMQAVISQIQARQADLLKKQTQLANEAEFYKKKAPPRELQDAMRTNQLELKTQQAAVAAKQQEMTQVRARFDEQKRRFAELTRARKTAEAVPATTAR